eukprot:scaffold49534_cov15-Tisochrysis_lutea.AAC.2
MLTGECMYVVVWHEQAICASHTGCMCFAMQHDLSTLVSPLLDTGRDSRLPWNHYPDLISAVFCNLTSPL